MTCGRVRTALWLLGGWLISAASWGHHSTAAYDLARSETIEGVVKSFQWANPHNYIQVIVTDSKGDAREWAVEAGTPVTASRMGWRKDSVKPGDHVTMVIAPMRDGTPAGTLKTVKLPNGTVLTSVAAAAQAASPFDSIPSLPRATKNP